jgi:hypothetical protein
MSISYCKQITLMKARRSSYKQKLMKLFVYQQVEVCVCVCVCMQCITIILNTLQCFDFYEVIYNKETPIELQCKCFPPVVITAVLSYYEPNIFFHGREMVIMLSCQTLTNKSHIFLVRHESRQTSLFL